MRIHMPREMFPSIQTHGQREPKKKRGDNNYSRKYLNAKINLGNIWRMYAPERHIDGQEKTSVEHTNLGFNLIAKASSL